MLRDTLSDSGARLHLLLQAPVVWGRQDAEGCCLGVLSTSETLKSVWFAREIKERPEQIPQSTFTSEHCGRQGG